MNAVKLTLVALAIALAGCGSSQPPAQDNAKAAPDPMQATKPLPNSNVFSSDVRALNKAKNVQNIVNQQNQKTRQVIKDSGG